jgi:hypothetical protein
MVEAMKQWLSLALGEEATATNWSIFMNSETLCFQANGKLIVTFHRDGRVLIGESTEPHKDSLIVFAEVKKWFNQGSAHGTDR